MATRFGGHKKSDELSTGIDKAKALRSIEKKVPAKRQEGPGTTIAVPAALDPISSNSALDVPDQA